MPRKKKSSDDTERKPSPEAYRKPFKPIRLRGVLAQAAEDRAEELAQDLTQYVNDAVRMRLESEGRWPPKGNQ